MATIITEVQDSIMVLLHSLDLRATRVYTLRTGTVATKHKKRQRCLEVGFRRMRDPEEALQ